MVVEELVGSRNPREIATAQAHVFHIDNFRFVRSQLHIPNQSSNARLNPVHSEAQHRQVFRSAQSLQFFIDSEVGCLFTIEALALENAFVFEEFKGIGQIGTRQLQRKKTKQKK
jgi:hypothetical protein